MIKKMDNVLTKEVIFESWLERINKDIPIKDIYEACSEEDKKEFKEAIVDYTLAVGFKTLQLSKEIKNRYHRIFDKVMNNYAFGAKK